MLESKCQFLQNVDAVSIGPVMKDLMKEIHVCSFKQLFCKEIVRHKFHAASQFRSNLRLAFRNDLGKFLDDAFHGGDIMRKDNT